MLSPLFLVVSSLALPLPSSFPTGAPAQGTAVAQPPSTAARGAPLSAQDVAAEFERLETQHANLAKRVPVGRSRGKQSILALRLAAGEQAAGRPALLVVANLEGPYAWTGGLALDEARELAARYASDDKVRALLDTTTLYFVPCPNPDATDARFATPRVEQRASAPGVDDDRDGRVGEDGPSDVDGDGRILMLRKLDPEGRWIADPADARAMMQADPVRGDHGRWKLFVEGRDSDHDEQVGEDPLLDVQVARNFPHGWNEHAPESGAWPTSEPEAQGLCDFVLAHRDIQLVVVYGALDTLVAPQKSGAGGSGGLLVSPPEADAKLLAELGKRYGALTSSKSKSEGDDRGTFQAWCQFERGLWCLSIAPWSLPLDAPAPKKEGNAPADKKDESGGKDAQAAGGEKDKKKDADEREPSDDTKRLRWIDEKGESWRFVAWKEFQHPELGAVEIGGFAPFARIEPPEGERAAIADAQRAFLVALGDLLARVQVVDAKAQDLGGVWKIEATLSDEALLPPISAAGRRTGTVRSVRVRLRLPADSKIVAGDAQTLVGDLAGSGGRRKLEWLVTTRDIGALRIEADTDFAGTASVAPVVQQRSQGK